MIRTTKSLPPVKKTDCFNCGRWPATLYVDISSKHTSARVCEDCVRTAKVIKNENDVYVTNPELPADSTEPVG